MSREQDDLAGIRRDLGLDNEDDLDFDYPEDTAYDRAVARAYEKGEPNAYNPTMILQREEFGGVRFQVKLQGPHNFVCPAWPLPLEHGRFNSIHSSARGDYGIYGLEESPIQSWAKLLVDKLWTIPGCTLVWVKPDEVGMHTNGIFTNEEVALMIREIVVPTLHLRMMERAA